MWVGDDANRSWCGPHSTKTGVACFIDNGGHPLSEKADLLCIL
ncbi:hypothetical protein JCM19237_473 [Photobacterium aphoticum]|uniref:Uncharacterized protein n=1 Tax=Photobacterium aphoticum TaxID=754436 RepID=A0A090QSY3_9GAMM|nr:hypothetical protein JCM19237_473 [Photobacterium aphoticum]